MATYDYVLPQVFRWVLKHVDASAAADLAKILVNSEVPAEDGYPPPPAGSSFRGGGWCQVRPEGIRGYLAERYFEEAPGTIES